MNKMGIIKDRNGVNLTKAEDTKRRQEYRETYNNNSNKIS